MKRAKIGDVIRIKTRRGFSHALYTHRHAQWGPLIRIFQNTPTEAAVGLDMDEIVSDQVLFSIFYPLGTAVNQAIVSVVGSVDIPAPLKAYPIFRTGLRDKETKKIKTWWLWDGEREWKVGELSEEQKKYPLRLIVNHAALVRKIEAEWTAESEC